MCSTSQPAIVLASNGQEWLGSFAIAVKALIKDILSDGEPFEARVTLDVTGYKVIAPVSADICAVEDDIVYARVLRHGKAAEFNFPLHEVVRIEVD